MAEVLEIQIQEKPSSTSSSSPPRPPSAAAVEPVVTPPRPPSAAAVEPVATPPRPPSAAAVEELATRTKVGTIAERFADILGFGKQFQAIRQLFDLVAGKPERERVAPAMTASAAKAAIGDNGTPAQIAELRELQYAIQDGFDRTGAFLQQIAGEFAKKHEGHLAAQGNRTAETKVQEPLGREAHRPASQGIGWPDPSPRPAGTGDTRMPIPARIPASNEATAEVGAAGEGGAAEAAAAGEVAELGAGAAAAGVGLSAVAAVALPVGIALGAVVAAVKLTEVAFKAAGDAAQFAGQELSMMARNNYLGMFQQGLSAATKAVSSVPLVGKSLGAVGEAAEKTVNAFASVVEAFIQRAHEMAGFSPAIAMAEQRQAIRGLFDDIKEANTLGPDLARMLDAETNFQHELREMFLPVKKIIVETLANVLEKANDWLPDIAKALVAILDGLKVVIGILDSLSLHVAHGLAEPTAKMLGQIAESLRKIKKNTDKDDKSPLTDPYLADLFSGRDWTLSEIADPWNNVNPDARPNIPQVQAFSGL